MAHGWVTLPLLLLLATGCGGGPSANARVDTSSPRSGTTSEPSAPATTENGSLGTSYEEELGQVLTAIGVKSPGSVEHEFNGARMGGPWRLRYVIVFATKNAAAVPNADPHTEKDVNGVPVGTFTQEAFGTETRFRCHGLTYTAANMRSQSATGSSTGPAARTLAKELLGALQCP